MEDPLGAVAQQAAVQQPVVVLRVVELPRRLVVAVEVPKVAAPRAVEVAEVPKVVAPQVVVGLPVAVAAPVVVPQAVGMAAVVVAVAR